MFTRAVKHVPEWFPGVGFKTFARIAKKDLDDSITPPFQRVKESFEVCESPLPLPIQLKRTSGGDSHYTIDHGYVFRGITGTC